MPSEFFNPADHLIDLVSIDLRSSQYSSSVARVNRLSESWRASENKAEAGEEETAGAEIEGQRGTKVTTVSRGGGTTSMTVALPVVLERHYKNLWRNKAVSQKASLRVGWD